MKKTAPLLLLGLTLGGCLSDSDTARNRSVLPLAGAPATSTKLSDEPRQLCESTMEGNDPKTVCY